VFNKNCQLCHTPERVRARHLTKEEWQQILNKMIGFGCRSGPPRRTSRSCSSTWSGLRARPDVVAAGGCTRIALAATTGGPGLPVEGQGPRDANLGTGVLAHLGETDAVVETGGREYLRSSQDRGGCTPSAPRFDLAVPRRLSRVCEVATFSIFRGPFTPVDLPQRAGTCRRRPRAGGLGCRGRSAGSGTVTATRGTSRNPPPTTPRAASHRVARWGNELGGEALASAEPANQATPRSSIRGCRRRAPCWGADG
jgi:hypothetical protein